jgi:hypothetical protein
MPCCIAPTRAANTSLRLTADHGIVCSMSRSDNGWDIAAMESFFSSLKTERTADKTYRTRDEARADVFDLHRKTRRAGTVPTAGRSTSGMSMSGRSLRALAGRGNAPLRPRTRGTPHRKTPKGQPDLLPLLADAIRLGAGRARRPFDAGLGHD